MSSVTLIIDALDYGITYNRHLRSQYFYNTGHNFFIQIHFYSFIHLRRSAPLSRGLYCKIITIVNDTSRVVRMMIVTGAPSCGVTNVRHSDDSRGVINAPKEHL